MSSITQPSDRITYTGDELQFELTRLFGHKAFQGSQQTVISQVMAGIDTIAVMPTGAGKSLCYQFPAMLLPGTTVVISPLIALMKDQYDSLPADVYERTTFINSTLEIDALNQRMSEILDGRYKLVYCAPERLRQQPFIDALRRAKISLLVVDEAHCVSMWGHDFRPDYLFLGKCLPLLGHPTLLALTATATPEIRDEIAGQLGRKLQPVVASVFRSNLFYEVETLDDKEQKLRRLLEICKEEKGTGVIYARSRESCEQLAAALRRAGVQAAHYHAGMSPDERTATQENFMLDRVRIIVATIAFGMGIDKSNVRLIVHFSPPDTLEGYVQESGRAGRDGRRSRCVLFMTAGDKSNLTRWKRQGQLKLEELRAIYKELARIVPQGRTHYVNLDELERAAGSALGKQFDSTTVRVAVSLLERVGLIVRHFDAPRTATVTVTNQGETADAPQLALFRDAALLQANRPARVDIAAMGQSLDMAPDGIEQLLLGWQEHGWVRYRSERRDPVIERLRPPLDVAGAINNMLRLQDEAQQHQISQMMTYATANRCRHVILAAHLGEKIGACETNCDYCAPPEGRAAPQAKEARSLPANPGQIIVECLLSFPFNVGKPSLVRALMGSAASNVTAQRVKHFGALEAAAAGSIERAIDDLADAGYVAFFESEEGFKLLRVANKAEQGVPDGAVSLKPKRQPKPLKQEREERQPRDRAARQDRPFTRLVLEPEEERPPTPQEADLFERLKAWRRVVANRQNLPPYIIFHDKTLWAIARARPQTEEEFLAVRGVGQNHLTRYGSELFELIAGE
ncbi:MAG: RecQ family ATP-dependent DNA helicase [Chloroflexota bacterium]